MYRLSLMMQTKKEEDKPFCLLLTATPHTGNLANMFNLWYFIRRKGGIPECFKKDGRPTEKAKAEYQKEKNYYTDTVCKGATTVAEYVARAECEFLEGMHDEGSAIRDKFLSAFTVVVTKDGRTRSIQKPQLTYEQYKKLKECEKKARAQQFLSLPENEDIKVQVTDAVNRFYTNTVMRSIMVRRRNDFQVKRNAFSYFFLPIDKKVPIKPASLLLDELPVFMMDNVPFYNYNEIADFFSDENAETREALFEGNAHFRKKDSAGSAGFSDYYYELLKSLAVNLRKSDYVRAIQVECGEANEEEAIFIAQCKCFITLLREIRNRKTSHRVITFFDYKKNDFIIMKKEKPAWEKLREYIKDNAPDLYNDIIEGKSTGRAADRASVNAENNAALRAYSENENGILFAEDQSFTEGLDLQNGNVVVNFEVPIDPLTVDQRIGRVYRMGQAEESVEVYSFANMTSLDGYCLAYFSRIGILSDVDGDATILSGCNSDNMLVLRCPTCHDVSLMPESDYEESLPICDICGCKMTPGTCRCEDGTVKPYFFCKENKNHRQEIDEKNPLRCELCDDKSVRDILVINEFVCDLDPTHRLRREKENGFDYRCMAKAQNKMFRREAQGDVYVECRKLCAIKNCPQKRPDDCLIKKDTEDFEAIPLCTVCRHRDTCNCRADLPVGESCVNCDFTARSLCGKYPYSINFGPDYKSAQCPLCGEGRLRPVKQNSFETFIRGRYEHDNRFADNFLIETKNTLMIKAILKFNDD